MLIPDFFKYGSLISMPLFAVMTLFLISRTCGFSFLRHTVSKSVLFLKNPKDVLLFRLSFLIKALFDLGFALFLLDHFQIYVFSALGMSLILMPMFFASLAWLTELNYHGAHVASAYASGICWVMAMISFSALVGNQIFLIATCLLGIFIAMISFGFFLARRVNVLVQMFCTVMLYIWCVYFVFWYL